MHVCSPLEVVGGGEGGRGGSRVCASHLWEGAFAGLAYRVSGSTLKPSPAHILPTPTDKYTRPPPARAPHVDGAQAVPGPGLH